MTSRQKLSIEESSLKGKINVLLEIEPDQLTDAQRGEMDQHTDAQRGEMDQHTGRLKNLGPELRAAIAAEGVEQAASSSVNSVRRSHTRTEPKFAPCSKGYKLATT